MQLFQNPKLMASSSITAQTCKQVIWSILLWTKARDKYLVISVLDGRCQLHKFTKSQFRSKCYDVRTSDCHPIAPNILSRSPTGPIHGMDENVDSDHEPDTLDSRFPANLVCPPESPGGQHPPHLQPSFPLELVQLPTDTHLPELSTQVETQPPTTSGTLPVHESVSLKCLSDPAEESTQDSTVPTSVPSLCRSTRTRKSPAWQCNDTWDMH